jgi:hypothetical protein
MPALVTGIHAFASKEKEDVDGRDKPGHDESMPTRLFNSLDELKHAVGELLVVSVHGIDRGHVTVLRQEQLLRTAALVAEVGVENL